MFEHDTKSLAIKEYNTIMDRADVMYPELKEHICERCGRAFADLEAHRPSSILGIIKLWTCRKQVSK